MKFQVGDIVKVTGPAPIFHNRIGEVIAVDEVRYEVGVQFTTNGHKDNMYFDADELSIAWTCPTCGGHGGCNCPIII